MITAWIAHLFWSFTGARNEGGAAYGLQSGIGGSVPDVMLLIGLLAWYWHRTCHVSRCWRPGRHPVDGTPYHACRRHHPDVPDKITAGHIEQANREKQ